MSVDPYAFELFQGGILVAAASGADSKAVAREAVHYSAVYSQEGPVKLLTYGFNLTESASPADRRIIGSDPE